VVFRIHKLSHQQSTDEDKSNRHSASVPNTTQGLRWIWAKIFPINDQAGKLERLCGIAHDITNRYGVMNEAGSKSRQPLILILEDSDSIAILLKGLLFKNGYAAVRSATIADAKDLFTTIKPDLIITDVHLPDGNGITFVNRLLKKRDPKQKDLP
jgi:hypothetical protein